MSEIYIYVQVKRTGGAKYISVSSKTRYTKKRQNDFQCFLPKPIRPKKFFKHQGGKKLNRKKNDDEYRMR